EIAAPYSVATSRNQLGKLPRTRQVFDANRLTSVGYSSWVTVGTSREEDPPRGHTEWSGMIANSQCRLSRTARCSLRRRHLPAATRTPCVLQRRSPSDGA